MDAEIRLDKAAIAKFERSPALLEALHDSGLLQDIVAEMQRRAPKDTGEGADSIDFELDDNAEFFRITWGKDQFYMAFHEFGTADQPARPFARPVADEYNHRR